MENFTIAGALFATDSNYVFFTRTQSIERTVLHSELMNVLFWSEYRLNQGLLNFFCVTGN
jgi:hypothetical protein